MNINHENNVVKTYTQIMLGQYGFLDKSPDALNICWDNNSILSQSDENNDPCCIITTSKTIFFLITFNVNAISKITDLMINIFSEDIYILLGKI